MKNYVGDNDIITVAVSDPITPTSGAPVRVGGFCGVALRDKSSTETKTTIRIRGVVNVTVRGVDGTGNSAVSVGDTLYYVDADTPKVSKKSSGTKFGYALGTVASGGTADIDVLLSN